MSTWKPAMALPKRKFFGNVPRTGPSLGLAGEAEGEEDAGDGSLDPLGLLEGSDPAAGSLPLLHAPAAIAVRKTPASIDAYAAARWAIGLVQAHMGPHLAPTELFTISSENRSRHGSAEDPLDPRFARSAGAVRVCP